MFVDLGVGERSRRELARVAMGPDKFVRSKFSRYLVLSCG
jgi:hypothetical protein